MCMSGGAVAQQEVFPPQGYMSTVPYSHLQPNISRTGYRFTLSLTRIKNGSVRHGTTPLEHLTHGSKRFHRPYRHSLEVLVFELSTLDH